MKKQIILFSFLAGFSFLCNSQVKFTPTVGLNFASARFTNGTGDSEVPSDLIPTYSSRMGLGLGLNVEIPFSEKFFFSPGLFYQNIGHKAKASMTETVGGISVSVAAEQEVKLNYLQVPLNFGFNIPAGEKLKFQIVAGPYFSYFMSGKAETTVTSSSAGMNISQSISSTLKPGKDPQESNSETGYVNPLDIGLNGGLNVVIQNKFTIGLNYVFGLSNIYPFYETEPSGYSRSDSEKLSNGVFSIRLGYSLFKAK